MKIRKPAQQLVEQSTDEQRNLNTVSRNSPSGAITRIKGQISVDLPSCGPAAVTIATVTLPGAQVGDMVIMTPPPAGLSVAVAVGAGYVSAANTVKLPLINPTAGALDPAVATFDYILNRSTPLTA